LQRKGRCVMMNLVDRPPQQAPCLKVSVRYYEKTSKTPTNSWFPQITRFHKLSEDR
jgi:hypothetical protein